MIQNTCPSMPGLLLYIFTCKHIKILNMRKIKHSEQAHRYANFIGYTLSFIPNCHTNTVHMLLELQLKASGDKCHEYST